MSGGVALAFDAVIAVLLVATIAWAVVLNRKLRVLRGSREELDRLVARLIESTDRAQSGLASLRATAESSGEMLNTKAGAARAAIDELAYLVERGGELACRLEAGISAGRRLETQAPPKPTPATADHVRPKRAVAAPAAHQERLLKALQGVR